MNLLAIFVLVVSSVVLTLQARKFYGAWINPVSAFCVLSFFHNWIGSLLNVFVEIEWGVNSPESARTAVLFVNAVGLWCFALGAWLVRNSGVRHQSSAVRTRIPLVRVFEWGYCAIAGFMLIMPFIMAGGFARAYGEGQAAHAPTSTNFAQLLNMRQALLIAGYTTSTLQGRKRALFYIGAFCFEILIALLSGGRKALMITAAGLLIVYVSTHRVRLATTLRTAFVLLVVGYLSVAVNVWRAGFKLPFRERFSRFTHGMASKEFEEHLIKGLMSADSEGVQSWVYRLWFQRGHQPLLYGRSYVQAAVNMVVPREFQGSLVDYQAAYFFKDRAYRGATKTGYDFTFTAEALLNFGPWLAGLSFLMLGMGVGTLYARWRHTASITLAMLYFYTFAVLTVTLRADSTGCFRYLWFGYGPLLVVAHLLSRGKVPANTLAGYRRLPRLWGWLNTATPAPPAPPSSSLAPALDTMPGQSPAFEKQEKRDADRNPRS
jgi:hypothetical protein